MQLVCVGDSITQRGQSPDGYLTLLSNWYSRRADVVNRGYSGYNSRWLLSLITQQTQPRTHRSTRSVWTGGEEDEEEGGGAEEHSTPSVLYTLCIGANDAVLPPLSPSRRQFVALDDFASHVSAIARLLLGANRGRSAVVLITPPATDPHAWAAFCAERDSGAGAPLPPFIRSAANTARYAQAVKDVGAELQLPVIDLFTLTSPAAVEEVEGGASVEPSTTPNPFLVDGLHLSSRGNVVLFTALLQLIAERWPQLTVSQLPMDAPFHGDLNHDNFIGKFT